MDKGTLLRQLPVYQGNYTKLVEHQNVQDIMGGIGYAHEIFKKDYDQIAKFFIADDTYTICQKLWNFCKKNIPYNIEDEKVQSVRSPAAILAMIDGGDCKNYAQFVGGVLDAINRQTDRNIDWFYRFASYDLFDNTPEHVFVVVRIDGKEVWIDPVLKKFDTRRPAYVYKVDKKVSGMALYMIKGIPKRKAAVGANLTRGYSGTNTVHRNYPTTINTLGCACICPPSLGSPRRKKRLGAPLVASQVQKTSTGSDKITAAGSAIATVGIGLEAIPAVGTVAGAVVIAVGALTSLAGKLFGSKWHDNNEIRWLIAFYQYYVLGQANANTDNKVNESYLQDCYNWFYAVLGVPLYDRNSLFLLCGRRGGTGYMQNPTYSYPQRAAGYLAYPPIHQLAANVTLDQAQAACYLADQLQFFTDATQTKSLPPGSWANIPVAPSLIQAAQAQQQNTTNSVQNQNLTSSNLIGPGIPTVPTPVVAATGGFINWIKANPLIAALGAAAIGYALYEESGNSHSKIIHVL